MKQWVTEQQGGVDNISLEDTAAPTEADLKDGEVLVEIGHVSLNYRDIEGKPGSASGTPAMR